MIRNGGVLAIDLSDFAAGVDRELFSKPFDEVGKGFLEDLLSRDLLKAPPKGRWPRYRDLVGPDENDKFGIDKFDHTRTSKFKFVIVTSSEPREELLGIFDAIRVLPNA